MSREEQIAAFLAEAGWAGTQIENMDADFSPRRYQRLHREDGATAIFMEAGPDQKTHEFVVLAWLLRTLNLSTPEIFAEKKADGLVLMEDFGEGNVGRLIDNKFEAESFYQRAAGTLAHLHRNFEATTVQDLKLPHFTAPFFTKQAEKFLDDYMPYAMQRQVAPEERKNFRSVWVDVLRPVDALPQTLMLRDFMPDNVMDLPERKSWRSLGLLDFQDSGIGPIAYDIASFCEVVRRDGGDRELMPTIAHYLERAQSPCLPGDLQKACILLAAQRHTRILGILGAIAQKDPQSKKLDYIPRVKKYLAQLLEDPALNPIKEWMTLTRVPL